MDNLCVAQTHAESVANLPRGLLHRQHVLDGHRVVTGIRSAMGVVRLMSDLAEQPEPVIAVERIVSLAEMKARYTLAVTRACNGNRAKASRVLGVSARTVTALLATARKLGLGGI